MIRKLIVSLISACVIAGTIFAVFAALYFIIPNRQSAKEIHLAEQVTDADTEADTEAVAQQTGESEENSSNIYVADVIQSLTLREQPDSNSKPIIEEGLPPMTRMEVQEFIPDTNFAYVKVLDGENKDLFGYVNTEYIVKEGEPTVRAISEYNYE